MENQSEKTNIIVDDDTRKLYSDYRLILIYIIMLIVFLFLFTLAFNPKWTLLGFINFKRIMCVMSFFAIYLSINMIQKMYLIVKKISRKITQVSEDEDYINAVIEYKTGMYITTQIMILLLRFALYVTFIGFFFSSQVDIFFKCFNSLSLVAVFGALAYLIKTEAILDKIYWKYDTQQYIESLQKDKKFDSFEKNTEKKFSKFEKEFFNLIDGIAESGSLMNYFRESLKNKK